MSDTKSKGGIPAWQRAQQPSQEQPRETSNDDIAPTPSESELEPETTSSTSPEESASLERPQTTTPSTSADPADQLETMKTFLQDPSVQNAPLEKKRAFFTSKGIATPLIDQVVAEHSDLQFSDFESFKQQQQQSSPPPLPPTQQQIAPTSSARPPSAPPIITYPEYLIEAHKPTPLVTLSRLWTTAQLAAGLSALLYGASTFLVAPMTDSLTEARHDFALHSQSKIDEFNEKLAGLVSKQPAYKPSTPSTTGEEDDDDDDTDTQRSEASDPTELFSRDMGTQTSPPTTRRPSTITPSPVLAAEQQKKDPTSYQVTGLEILTSHINELLELSTGKLEPANKARHEKSSALRHYLDTCMFASGPVAMWSNSLDDEAAGKEGGKDKEKEDAGEELKKEIRGVKGVMLSAKRFPGVGGGGGAVGVGRSG